MSNRTLRLQRADEETIAYVETLLDKNGLPSDDVEPGRNRFYIGYDGDTRVGVGGVERHGTDGLLRSVVIERSARGNRYGTALCEALESKVEADGVERLYLLTTTAAEFFGDCGYVETDRTTAPNAIRQTAEFDELCPVTATCMVKSL
ncbi:arsenic resistance N-acetyltransferase ArsN2 [Halorubrum lacusprofundi]|jgi:amino-acid N-acetyltransferase|uniref:GCN5-related N-acetyltransferase n=1 Tax=Halorubrum lacusprofundi (strain ATCC 49239 / DSM 5036 / JCM 8891 / ACAM 34) TaxID=416348 RepID=B9LNR2_HALLT|nr:arsenic resistance N-acetyltransferase ArsN2 [Halorubrum lacusprofundi]ACM57000.1 GCN5-related N-acetyltransferase [Halorubrum lacusprofundi ATCC 49239]MCG1006635.1 arsenic resistance N-acetyltransferase ArsN2 [Halorubrum lacusprofundi]